MRALLAALAVLALPHAVRAQCGARQSQCRTCHLLQGENAPPCDGAKPWHRDHAFASFCADCHGGDPEATEIGRAHAGLGWPLEAAGERCAKCHPGTAARLVAPYLAARAAPPAPQAGPSRAGNAVLAGLAVLLAAGGSAWVAVNERRLRSRP